MSRHLEEATKCLPMCALIFQYKSNKTATRGACASHQSLRQAMAREFSAVVASDVRSGDWVTSVFTVVASDARSGRLGHVSLQESLRQTRVREFSAVVASD